MIEIWQAENDPQETVAVKTDERPFPCIADIPKALQKPKFNQSVHAI